MYFICINNYFKSFFVLALLFILTACTGTGSTSLNSNDLKISNGNTKMFIYRDKTFGCSGCLATVYLNGKEVGKLGNGEYISSLITSSSNTIKVKTTGLQGIGIGEGKKRFSKSNSNSYFLVEYKTGLLSAGWKVIEISESEFKSNL